MKFGLCLPIRRDCSLKFNIDLAIRAEELGFDSVWVSDHIIIPSNTKNIFSSIFYDPFILLTAIGAKTKNIRLGTSAVVLPYRNPVVVAKMLTTLDTLSEGRLIFGVVPGWLKEEFDALNANFKERGKITDEYLQAISELLSSDDPVFRGESVSFSDIEFYPKPYNNRKIETWIGGSSKSAMERSLKYGTGWQPTWVSPEDISELINYLTTVSDDMNVNMENFTISVRNRVKFNTEANPQNNPIYMFSGDMDAINLEIQSFKKAGINHIVFDPETTSNLETMEMAEQLSEKVIKFFD